MVEYDLPLQEPLTSKEANDCRASHGHHASISAERFQRPPEDLYSDQQAQGLLGTDRDACLDILRLFIVFAKFPGVYKADWMMVLIKDEDVLPAKFSIFSSISVEPLLPDRA